MRPIFKWKGNQLRLYIKMTQMLELAHKNFKEAIITMLKNRNETVLVRNYIIETVRKERELLKKKEPKGNWEKKIEDFWERTSHVWIYYHTGDKRKKSQWTWR